MAQLPLNSVSRTDKGRVRDANEDYYGYFDTDEYAELGGKLFVVADGVGGAEFGEVASRQTVATLSDTYYAQMRANPDLPVDEALLNAIAHANARVYKEAQHREVAGQMGSTVVAAVVRGQRLYVAWAGDSRAYLANPRESRLRQLTTDHTTAEEYRRLGQPVPRDAVPDALSRGVGVNPNIIPECVSGDLEPDDVVLLCSDGLYNYFNSEDLRQDLLSPQKLETMADALVETAKTRGGADNITLITLAVGEQAWRQTPASSTRVAPPAGSVQTSRPLPRGVLVLGFAGVLVIGLLLGLVIGSSRGTPAAQLEPTFVPLATITSVPTLTPQTSATATMAPTENLVLAEPVIPPLPPAEYFIRQADVVECGGETREESCENWTPDTRVYLLQASGIYTSAGGVLPEIRYATNDMFTIQSDPSTQKACYIVTSNCWWYTVAKDGVHGWMPQNILTIDRPEGLPLLPTATIQPRFGDYPQNEGQPTPVPGPITEPVPDQTEEQSQPEISPAPESGAEALPEPQQ